MNYQSTPDEPGVFPSLEWFEKMKEHVDFKDKYVLDIGCAQGVFMLLALQQGARFAYGIDNEEEKITFAKKLLKTWKEKSYLMHDDVFNIFNKLEYIGSEILICSMIIHWIGRMDFVRLADKAEKVIVIYREKNDGYQIPINGKWFPTQEELDKSLEGFELIHKEFLMEQDNNKRINLAIYGRKKG